jgi:arsenate reductase
MASSDITIYHNPQCSNSRKALELIRAAGHEPRIVEYLKNPPSREELRSLGRRAGGIRGLLREKEPLCAELGLDDPAVSEAQIAEAMAAHPVLINRPIVVTGKGVKLCRPGEGVLEVL